MDSVGIPVNQSEEFINEIFIVLKFILGIAPKRKGKFYLDLPATRRSGHGASYDAMKNSVSSLGSVSFSVLNSNLNIFINSLKC